MVTNAFHSYMRAVNNNGTLAQPLNKYVTKIKIKQLKYSEKVNR